MHLARISELLTPFLSAPLSDAQLAQLAAYLEILHRWNARMNLTAVRDPEQVITRHFGESFFAAQHLFPQRLAASDRRLLDIGSGAGFPGLPIKIWAPELQVILIESQSKKATFLKEVIRALELKDANVIAKRAEDLIGGSTGVPLVTQNSNPCHPERGRAEERGESESKDLMFSPTTSDQRPATVTLRAVEKFDRILPVAAQLASGGRLALLIGSVQVASAQKLLPDFTWSDPVPIPLSLSRVLLVGESKSPRIN